MGLHGVNHMEYINKDNYKSLGDSFFMSPPTFMDLSMTHTSSCHTLLHHSWLKLSKHQYCENKMMCS
jgi:hypothetical protein